MQGRAGPATLGVGGVSITDFEDGFPGRISNCPTHLKEGKGFAFIFEWHDKLVILSVMQVKLKLLSGMGQCKWVLQV